MNPQLAALLALMKRYPWCVACIAVALVCGGGAFWFSLDLDDLAEPYAQRGKKYEEMLTLTKGGLTQKQELEQVMATTKRIDENLMADELIDNNWYFYKFEEQTKAHLGELHQLNTPPTDNSPNFRRVPYTIRVSGTYEQVGNFLLALETGPRLMRATSFSVSRSTGGNKDRGGRDGGSTEPADDVVSSVTLDANIELLGKK